ncbi:hypothetical protein CRI94_00605 [Longibacter salinarum]|uniref:DUF4249 domain-containing protein n=2 Tax=Longibacter salinarum TaxID=1850348 RepID=A0A2A8D1R2_9BACT|nr:hypothetical protein CRI94_00605 [Longibacter salinarum]
MVGCDTTIDAVQPRDEYQFSMYGVLDVGRDTQWIRVEDLRDSLPLGARDDINATVMLTDETTGTSVELNDSIFTFASARDLRQHNFWTTLPIRGMHTYRIDVIREGDVRASATTSTPDPDYDYETINVTADSFDFVTSGIPMVAGARLDIELDAREDFGCSESPFTARLDIYASVTQTGDSEFTTPVDYVSFLDQPRYRCYRRADSLVTLHFTAAGSDWPELDAYNDLAFEDVVRPDSFSNVSGGHGYVAGVVRRTYTIDVTEENARILSVE